MLLKDTLSVYLITYDRDHYLDRTLEQILSQDSPIRNVDITILDNASKDNTSDVVQKWQKSFQNLHYIKNAINIGGNVNIVRAYEMGANSGKEYVWVLCDDDKYDFSNWNEVENAMANGVDAICLADYVFPSAKEKTDKAYQIFQMTFVPANIVKISNITDTVLTNMYDAIYTMFQQCCIIMDLVNKGKRIHVLSKPIAFNGLHESDRCSDVEYTRGSDVREVLPRRLEQNWIIGFANIVRLLNDMDLQKKCMEVAIPYKDIYGSWKNFYRSMISYRKTPYFLEVNHVLPDDRKITKGKVIAFYFYHTIIRPVMQTVFSVTKTDGGEFKIITVLGIKMKIKNS